MPLHCPRRDAERGHLRAPRPRTEPSGGRGSRQPYPTLSKWNRHMAHSHFERGCGARTGLGLQ
jgi:hypothetical protein